MDCELLNRRVAALVGNSRRDRRKRSRPQFRLVSVDWGVYGVVVVGRDMGCIETKLSIAVNVLATALVVLTPALSAKPEEVRLLKSRNLSLVTPKSYYSLLVASQWSAGRLSPR